MRLVTFVEDHMICCYLFAEERRANRVLVCILLVELASVLLLLTLRFVARFTCLVFWEVKDIVVLGRLAFM